MVMPLRYVEGSDLFTCGNYIYNQYTDCKETSHYLCSDKINDILTLPMEKFPGVMPILACEDRVLRVLQVTLTIVL